MSTNHTVDAPLSEAEHTFEVTVIVEALDVRETYTVKAPREGLAKTHAISEYLRGDKRHPDFSGSFVTYEVTQLD